MNATCKFVVVGDDRAAFDGVKQLGRVEAERADIAPVQHRLPGVTHGEGVGAVVHHFQIAATGDFFDAFNGARVAEHVSADDGRGVRHDAAFDVLGRNVPGLGVDVSEDRADAFPLQRAAGGHEAERGGHCTAAQAQRAVGDLKGEGTVVGEDDVLDTQIVFEALLQFTHQRAMVGQPATGIDAFDISLELVDIAQVGLGYVDHRILHF